MRKLYLFVDSERSDQYVNSIVHCVLQRDVRQVFFLHIKTLTSAEAVYENTGLSARVMAAVQSQLEGLADRREYLRRSEGRADERIALGDVYDESRASEISKYYRRIRELPISYSNREVEYAELRQTLRNIAAEKDDAFLDITAVKKRYVGDIVAAGLVEGLRGLWTFDLLAGASDFARPWRMLIHDLRDETAQRYKYTNVLDTDTYKACARLVFIRTPTYRWAAAAVILLMLLGGIGYTILGDNSTFFKVISVVASISGILSLGFVFHPPRDRA